MAQGRLFFSLGSCICSPPNIRLDSKNPELDHDYTILKMASLQARICTGIRKCKIESEKG